MDILLYLSKKDGVGAQLKSIIESLPFGEKLEVYNSIESLDIRLRNTLYEAAIAVLLADTKEALSRIYTIGHLLNEISIILIIPDQDEDTIRKAHTLRPRFLTYKDSNFKDVAAVLEKLFKKECSKQFLI
ncbi:MAG: hypothetical protein GY846_06705 [Deltaproteobacteria bacterium]|nr:hypothetical protein [Deltaproteobacteria bacterium]